MAFYKKFIPVSYYPNIFDIDYQTLTKQGVKSLFFDLDNTIIAYDEQKMSEKTFAFLKELQKDFKIIIVSNSQKSRVKLAADQYPYVHFAKKPLLFGLKKAVRMAGFEKDEVVLIGDQVMTDVFGANRLKIKSILIKPIKKSSDKWITSLNRFFAKCILKGVKKRYPKAYKELIEPYEN
ncbi:YqeG family HAD IIIA-type phosphatase [Mycoplasmatota bacterium]|nr:YqeG family HAD IIIA-type phosphatase [Mycoplasmatota bacterium]